MAKPPVLLQRSLIEDILDCAGLPEDVIEDIQDAVEAADREYDGCRADAALKNAAALLDLLTNGTPHREVYLAGDRSGWYVTYGGGEVSAEAVAELVRDGKIQSVYADLPDECYHVGKTLDTVRTQAERRIHGKGAGKFYTDGTVET